MSRPRPRRHQRVWAVQLAPKILVRRVVRWLSGQPEVRVVVGCRTADWPAGLGEGLATVVGSFDVLELLPLSVEDIASLPGGRSVEAAGFLSAVRNAGPGPLFSLPRTVEPHLRDMVGAQGDHHPLHARAEDGARGKTRSAEQVAGILTRDASHGGGP